jgi:hypothetical protein
MVGVDQRWKPQRLSDHSSQNTRCRNDAHSGGAQRPRSSRVGADADDPITPGRERRSVRRAEGGGVDLEIKRGRKSLCSPWRSPLSNCFLARGLVQRNKKQPVPLGPDHTCLEKRRTTSRNACRIARRCGSDRARVPASCCLGNRGNQQRPVTSRRLPLSTTASTPRTLSRLASLVPTVLSAHD